jgi:diacylglycerol kinase family enzyme
MPLRPRVAVLLNASAGMLEAQRSDILREALAVTFEQYGISAALEFLAGPELHATAQHAAQGFRDQELDAIVVGTAIPLGILPLGTLNHFARDLGIPTTIPDAVALIASR